MDILGIGLPELALILLIALLVIGPKDMQKAARTFGRWLRKARTSEVWRSVVQVRDETRWYLHRLEREIELEEVKKEIERQLLPSSEQSASSPTGEEAPVGSAPPPQPSETASRPNAPEPSPPSHEAER